MARIFSDIWKRFLAVGTARRGGNAFQHSITRTLSEDVDGTTLDIFAVHHTTMVACHI